MKKYIKYGRYIARHKWYVFLACVSLAKTLPFWLAVRLLFRGVVHDWSKLLPSEWLPYMNFFYGEFLDEEERQQMFRIIGHCSAPTKEEAKIEFDIAWNHHQKRNKHHWQYWVLHNDNGKTEALQMPDLYFYEMIADWVGAGRAIHGKVEVCTWFANNRCKMILNRVTESRIDHLLFTHFDGR